MKYCVSRQSCKTCSAVVPSTCFEESVYARYNGTEIHDSVAVTAREALQHLVLLSLEGPCRHIVLLAHCKT